MVRLLPFIIIPVLLVLGFGVWRMYANKPAQNPTTSVDNVSTGPVEVPKTLPQQSSEDKIKTLEEGITTLTKEVNNLKTENSSLNVKLKALEGVDTDITTRVSALEKATPAPTAASSTSKSTVYIPLGGGGSWGDQDWYTLTDYQVNLDPANFPGYTGMVLEIIFRLAESAGTGYVRLYNTTDGSVTSSEITTTSTTFGLSSSSSFKLAPGSKNYALQVKSSQGKTLFIQTARIRVNF